MLILFHNYFFFKILVLLQIAEATVEAVVVAVTISVVITVLVAVRSTVSNISSDYHTTAMCSISCVLVILF